MTTRPVYSVFLDESSQTQHRHLTLGCLVIDQQRLPYFELAVRHARYLELKGGEMKWVKISSAKQFAYKLAIDCFFDFEADTSPLHFHALVVDTSKRNEKVFNNGSKELGFNKEVYQLLMKCARLYPDALFDVTADHRDTEFTTEELRRILNNGCAKSGDARPQPFRRVAFRDSKQVISLQMVDLLLGSLSFRINGHHEKPGASQVKLHVSEYVLGRASIRDPMRDTSRSGKFTIWHRQLKASGPAGSRS